MQIISIPENRNAIIRIDALEILEKNIGLTPEQQKELTKLLKAVDEFETILMNLD